MALHGLDHASHCAAHRGTRRRGPSGGRSAAPACRRVAVHRLRARLTASTASSCACARRARSAACAAARQARSACGGPAASQCRASSVVASGSTGQRLGRPRVQPCAPARGEAGVHRVADQGVAEDQPVHAVLTDQAGGLARARGGRARRPRPPGPRRRASPGRTADPARRRPGAAPRSPPRAGPRAGSSTSWTAVGGWASASRPCRSWRAEARRAYSTRKKGLPSVRSRSRDGVLVRRVARGDGVDHRGRRVLVEARQLDAQGVRPGHRLGDVGQRAGRVGAGPARSATQSRGVSSADSASSRSTRSVAVSAQCRSSRTSSDRGACAASRSRRATASHVRNSPPGGVADLGQLGPERLEHALPGPQRRRTVVLGAPPHGTRSPRARASAASSAQSRLLPIPGSPVTTANRVVPAGGLVERRCAAGRAGASRPSIGQGATARRRRRRCRWRPAPVRRRRAAGPAGPARGAVPSAGGVQARAGSCRRTAPAARAARHRGRCRAPRRARAAPGGRPPGPPPDGRRGSARARAAPTAAPAAGAGR